MPYFVAMRLIYSAYLFVSVLILYKALSRFLFHKEFRNIRSLGLALGFAVIWPLAFFSRNGRRQLRGALPFIDLLNKGGKK